MLLQNGDWWSLTDQDKNMEKYGSSQALIPSLPKKGSQIANANSETCYILVRCKTYMNDTGTYYKS